MSVIGDAVQIDRRRRSVRTKHLPLSLVVR
jgi:hypothetical protein